MRQEKYKHKYLNNLLELGYVNRSIALFAMDLVFRFIAVLVGIHQLYKLMM